MSNSLPNHPNLEHLRSQAKSLLSRYKSGDASAAADFKAHVPGFSSTSSLSLADAQSAIARKHGFESWQQLVRHVEALDQIEGTWAFTSMIIEGTTMPESASQWARLTIDGKNFQMSSAGDVYEGHCEIDVEQSPPWIDIHFTEGPEKGNSSLGIFECDGREFRICLGFTGIPRPSAFESLPGSGVALETLRRSGDGDGNGPAGPNPTMVEATPAMLDGFGLVSSEMEKLQGVWKPVSLIRNGMELPQNFLGMGNREMTGSRMVVSFGGQVQVHALVKINTDATPMEIDYLIQEGADSGKLQLGIMEWDGQNVRFCFALPGAARPAEFAAGPQDRNTLAVWKPR